MRSTVLIVDDDPDFLGAVEEILTQSGHSVVATQSCRDGVALARAVRPDVVLVDC